jgi:hypothetical protein
LLVAIALSGLASCRTAETGEEGGEGSAEFHRHAANVFAGGSWTEDGESDYATRLDYEYLFSEMVGVGAFLDYVFGDVRDLGLGVGATLHPVESLSVSVMPGVVHGKDGDWDAILRFGGAWEFELGQGFVVGPAAYYDLSPGVDVFVLGALFGYRF